MKNISIRLHQFVTESLHPKTIIGQRFAPSEFEKWKHFIAEETNDLYIRSSKLSFSNRKRREEYIGNLLDEIIFLSNTVNGYLLKYLSIWKNKAEAAEIRQGYLFICLAFESLIEKLGAKYPGVLEHCRYTDFVLQSVKIERRSQLVSLRKHLLLQLRDSGLTTVLLEGISDLINQRPFVRSFDKYLNKLMTELTNKPFESTTALMDIMIINDFNLPSFFLFCVDTWSGQLSGVDGLLEQKEMLLEVKSHLFDLTLAKGLKFPSSDKRFYNELNNFLSEKYALVKERLKINRQFAADESLRPRAKRVLINLSVAQLGLFIRLQVEKGILAREHIGELFAFFARHFYTPNTDFISAESLQKKSSDVEHATAVKLKAHLIAMLNWLNTHYNLSNFN